MPHQFIPFGPAPRLPEETSEPKAALFAPIAPAKSPEPSVSSGNHAEKCGPPKINLKRDGNRVTNIEVECSCGQVFSLECVY